MSSPDKKKELWRLLTLQSFIEECIASISKYVHDKSEAISLYDATALELFKQNVDKVEDLQAFIKKAMQNKAKAYFKQQANNKETTTNQFDERSAVSPAFSHMRFSEVRNAVKQHRTELDFIIFELNSQGYTHREIADMLNDANMNEGAVRKRFWDLRKWINRFFNER